MNFIIKLFGGYTKEEYDRKGVTPTETCNCSTLESRLLEMTNKNVELINELESLKESNEYYKASLSEIMVDSKREECISAAWKTETFYIDEEVYKHIVEHDPGLPYTEYNVNENNMADYKEIIEQRKSLRMVCNEYYNLTARNPEERRYYEFLKYFNSTPVAYALYYDKGYVGTPLVKKVEE